MFYRADGWVKTSQGPAVSGAQVYVCTQPTSDIKDIPPAPLATLYSDSLGTNVLPQPVITDGFGHYDFYAATGEYTIIIVNNGAIQQTYPDQTIGGVGSGVTSLNGLIGDVSVQAGSNITINVVGSSVVISATVPPAGGVTSLNSLSGDLNIIAGSGITVTPSGSNIQITNSGGGFQPASGMNIISLPIPPGVGNNQNPFGIPNSWGVYNPAATGPSSNIYIPGTSILIPCTTWKLSLWQGTAVSTQAFKMQIYKVAQGSLTVLATAQITFGGSATPSFSTPGTVLVSDTISFPISQAYDYYIVYDTITGFPSISTGNTPQNNIWITAADNYGLSVGNSLNMGSGSAQAGKTILVSWTAQS